MQFITFLLFYQGNIRLLMFQGIGFNLNKYGFSHSQATKKYPNKHRK